MQRLQTGQDCPTPTGAVPLGARNVIDIDEYIKALIATKQGDLAKDISSLSSNEDECVKIFGIDKKNSFLIRLAQVIAQCLVDNTSCSELGLPYNGFEERCCVYIGDALAQNVTLTDVDLEGNWLGDCGTAALFSGLLFNKGVTKISLRRNTIGDVGAKSIGETLKINTTLKDINLQENRIGSSGAASIAEGLMQNSTLTEINLLQNKIGDPGAECIGNALRYNKTLQTLNLSFNEIGVKGVLCIATGIRIGGYVNTSLDEPKRDGPSLMNDALQSLSLIGKGHYGSAYKADHFEECWVLKVAHEERSAEELFESLLLSCLPEHPNVLKLIGIHQESNSSKNSLLEDISKKDYINTSVQDLGCTVLIVEGHPGGSLETFVKQRKGNFPLHKRLKFCLGMALGIQHLHRHDIIHRDIALRNFVLSENNEHVVLIDFGLARGVKEGELAPVLPGGSFPTQSSPPETLFPPHLSGKSSDIWLLGIAFWEMLNIHNGTPFREHQSLESLRTFLKETMEQYGDDIPLRFSDATAGVIRGLTRFCCKYDYLARPSIDEVVAEIERIGKREGKLELRHLTCIRCHKRPANSSRESYVCSPCYDTNRYWFGRRKWCQKCGQNAYRNPQTGEWSRTCHRCYDLEAKTQNVSDIWACPACTYHNKAMSRRCSMCSGPKPAEQRSHSKEEANDSVENFNNYIPRYSLQEQVHPSSNPLSEELGESKENCVKSLVGGRYYFHEGGDVTKPVEGSSKYFMENDLPEEQCNESDYFMENNLPEKRIESLNLKDG